MSSRLFSISCGVAFLPTLADALLDGRIIDGFPNRQDALSLSKATLYLPTRRAARALSALIAERISGPVLLPRIVPLGDVDELDAMAEEADLSTLEHLAELDPAIPDLERRLILTRLALQWVEVVDRALMRLSAAERPLVPASPADAYALAGDLARLMDSLATEGLPWDSLKNLVEERFSAYFQITLDFVRIAAEQWPEILQERGVTDPAARRDALLRAAAKRLRLHPPKDPVIVAGSTGTFPAVSELIAAVATCGNGAVILPGLDHSLDEDTWDMILDGEDPACSHPQYGLAKLLARLKVKREAIPLLGSTHAHTQARHSLCSQALRPADTTALWAAVPEDERRALATEALSNIAIIEAHDEREEALAAAVALRETLADPHATAILVTPDRALAERVSAELKRWGVLVDDSAGQALDRSEAGRLARLAAEVFTDHFAPASLLALLSHPDVRLGWPRKTVEQAAAALEIGVLRGPALPDSGLDAIRNALAQKRQAALDHHAIRPIKRLAPDDWDLVAELIDRLEKAQGLFTPAHVLKAHLDLVAISRRHRLFLEHLTQKPDDEGENTQVRPDWEALHSLFDDLDMAECGPFRGGFQDYPAFFTAIASERVLRRGGAAHRRIKILGLLEARLLPADRIILGGLDEALWPPATRTDAFLNRPMRSALGLGPPERRIGQTAHDFVQLLGGKDVIITRALKRGDAPTVPSRLLQRLRAFAGDEAWKETLQAGERYIRLGQVLEQAPAKPRLKRPAPKPPLELLPKSLSVTEAETLIRDPYAVYARHVLKLDPLEPLSVEVGPSHKGSLIHEALATFAQAYPAYMPEEAQPILLEMGHQAFRQLEAYPTIQARWWPRFESLVDAFVPWDSQRRNEIAQLLVERPGKLPIDIGNGCVVTLRGRADRIEIRRDGSLCLIDYKTGSPPSAKQVMIGFSPQLTLLAAMARHGAFQDCPAHKGEVSLCYVKLTGGAEPLKQLDIAPAPKDERSLDDVIEDHMSSFQKLLSRYYRGEQGFVSRPFPQFAKVGGLYDHLARVKEWSATGGEGEEAEDA